MSDDDVGVVRLTSAERAILHAGVCARHGDNVPGVYICRPCEDAGDDAVEQIIAERVEAAWDEGHSVGALDQANLAIWNHPPTPNPYRAAALDSGGAL